MTFDHRYSSTVPAPLDGMPAPPPAPESAIDVRQAEFQAAGAVGAELNTVLVRMRRALEGLQRKHPEAAAACVVLQQGVEEATRIARQSRLLARLAQDAPRPRNEHVRLDQLLEAVLDARLQAGPTVPCERAIAAATVHVDRDLTSALVEAALDAALSPGHRLEVALHIKDWPAHALLRIGALAPGVTDTQDDAHERVSWYLVCELARLLGVTVDRVRTPGQLQMVLEFPRTVRELDGLTAMEVDMDMPSALGDSPRVLAGHRALIISSDVKLREEVKRVCRDMGMVVDNVPSSALAAQRCAVDAPDVLIVDERFNDERFAQLREQMNQVRAHFPVVEIAYGSSSSPAMASWGSAGPARVGRGDLQSQLPQVLALEMSKAL